MHPSSNWQPEYIYLIYGILLVGFDRDWNGDPQRYSPPCLPTELMPLVLFVQSPSKYLEDLLETHAAPFTSVQVFPLQIFASHHHRY
ncbi:hypothetical protein L211DRAFT_254735 [Terfezia boudieri ATCC MYA-4762]|uniref:Uncharacterized protein n=1 Tax=Terfezia boudieri ATCC MYA-4762 TaxID=1051890 RepID=A0A3N4M1L4_9PEZI|nr:hypothetical protein L211DRAFT_254735 [Terfezia boudieri ATCC MYA-4762]